jgi:hypothetical protein
MRKFLLFLALLPWAAWADDLPARQGLQDFRVPMEVIVKEAAKGQAAELSAIAAAYKDAGTAWQKVSGQSLELDKYGVPTDRQEEVWRQVRMMAMLMNYLDEGVKSSNRGLLLRAAQLMPEAYEKLAISLGAR